jgi:2-C-methyl-D-erythritol 4-phosphate cytidylyltransferase
MKAWAIIAAAGIGKRMGGTTPKQYLELGRRPIICHSLDSFNHASTIESVVIVVEPGREGDFRKDILEAFKYPAKWKVVGGGSVRQQSVANGLKAVPDDCDVVVVHDGVRPFIYPAVIDESVRLAKMSGACIVATPIKETIKSVDAHGMIDFTVDRSVLWGAKTPQSFKREVLEEAMRKAAEDNFFGTDEASLVERMGINVKVIEGDERNIKITTPSDLKVAEAILKDWIL